MDKKEEIKEFKPKMRITLLDKEGRYISDRLVDTASELYSGPKFKHKGPLRLEVTLTSNQDVNSFKEYIDKLVGDLPIKEANIGRGRPSSTVKQLESPREDILVKVEDMVNKKNTQEDIIKYLRELGFVFILTEDLKLYFPDFPFKERDIGKPLEESKQYPHSFSWMIRCIRRGKDPKTDKFDPMIIFGFSIIDGPSKKIIPYLYKERKNPLRVEPPKKALSFSDVEFTKFPKYQREDERLKWSTELRVLLNNKDKKPSKFFLRWSPDILVPDDDYKNLHGRFSNLVLKNDRL